MTIIVSCHIIHYTPLPFSSHFAQSIRVYTPLSAGFFNKNPQNAIPMPVYA
jgi:hypothetical protein